MIINNNITLTEALKISKPYDEGSHSKDLFERIVRACPSLNDSFREQYSEEFQQAVNEKGLCFMTTMDRCIFHYEPKLEVVYVGPERMPAISLYFPKNYW